MADVFIDSGGRKLFERRRAAAILNKGDASLAIWSSPLDEPAALTVAAETPLRDTRPIGTDWL